jgi:hypothetical protein
MAKRSVVDGNHDLGSRAVVSRKAYSAPCELSCLQSYRLARQRSQKMYKTARNLQDAEMQKYIYNRTRQWTVKIEL